MQEQVTKYLSKLIRHGLIEDGDSASLYGLDDEIYTNAPSVPAEVQALFTLLNINSLAVIKPEPTLWEIITRLAEGGPEFLCPRDCESLTFIHDIPVVPSLDPRLVARALNRRKGCIVKGLGIVTIGTVSLEQAFIVASSICFAAFVKFFSDAINGLYGYGCACRPDSRMIAAVADLVGKVAPSGGSTIVSSRIPAGDAEIIDAMDRAGKAVVEAKLVDSFFGNISYRSGGVVFISQTGSSLDELTGYIDRVPLDGSSTCSITSSSELMAHVKTYELTGDDAILHGHPRFSVIMSMFGDDLAFGSTRSIQGVPIVAGEVGAGKHGLLHTLPIAMQESHAAVVSGHGTFASCRGSFAEAFGRLAGIEVMCYEAYCRKLTQALGG